MSLDHGLLNIPLSKRGNIDAQIDRFKAQEAADRKAAAKVQSQETATARVTAKALLETASAERITQLAQRCNLTVAAMRKRLASEAHWQPKLVIGLLAPLA